MKFPDARPAVIGSILTPEGLAFLAEATSPADAMEVRVDALLAAGLTLEAIAEALKKRRHPVLLTPRLSEEGGRYEWKGPDRAAAYQQLLPHVEAIDVELIQAGEQAPVMARALEDGKTVILSAHAFGKAAVLEQFADWLRHHDEHDKPDQRTILKIAGHIDSWRDLQRLAALLVNYPEKEIAVMGLGPHAAQSRSVLAALGSRLVYGWLDEPAAPGQPSAAEVREMVEALPPQSA